MLASATVETLAVPTSAGHPELVHVTRRATSPKIAASLTVVNDPALDFRPPAEAPDVFGDLQG
jgi:hypothetical protein